MQKLPEKAKLPTCCTTSSNSYDSSFGYSWDQEQEQEQDQEQEQHVLPLLNLNLGRSHTAALRRPCQFRTVFSARVQIKSHGG